MKHANAFQLLFALAVLTVGLTLTFAQAPPAPKVSQPTAEQQRLIREKLIKAYRDRGQEPPAHLTNAIPVKPTSLPKPSATRPVRGAAAPPAPAVNRTPPAPGPTRRQTPPSPSATATAPPSPGASRTVAQPVAPGTATQPATTPPAPALPAGSAPAAGANSAAPSGQPAEQVFEAGFIDFPNIELVQLLDFYSELVNRTLLRATGLPEATITIQTKTKLTLDEAIQALDTVLAMNGISMLPFGDKFIKVVPNAEFPNNPTQINTNSAAELPWADQPITQIVALKHTLPSEMVAAIEPFSKNQGGIVPLDSSNVLVIRDFAANVKRMLEIIEKVDVVIPRKVDLEVIPIKFALATDISSVLGGLTSGGGGVRTTTSGSSRLGRSSSRLGSSSSRLGGSSSSRTSSTLGRTSSSVRPQSTTSRTGSGASSFQSRLQQIARSAAGGSGSSGGIGGDGEILGESIIIPDERTNALLVFGTEEERKMVKSIVEKLDKVQPQVLIEAIILEVSLNDSKSIGVSSAQGARNFGSTVGVGGINNLGGLFGSSSVTNFPGSLGDGFSYFGLFPENIEVAVQAVANDGRINVLSRPRIQTSHAEPANIFVGNTVPFVTGTFTDITGGGRSQFQNERVGISLDVLPLINEDGLVVMEISQEIQQLGVPTTIDGNEVPTTTERSAETKVAVKDGDTIVIGGFISSQRSSSQSGVPWLKDIPLLGGLFRSKSDSNQRVELIVLIRPTVLETPELAALTASEERDKLLGVKQAELDLRKEEQENYKKIEKELEKQAAREQRKMEREEK